jgi:transcription antitermination factor NusG
LAVMPLTNSGVSAEGSKFRETLPWYALRVRPRHESRVYDQLQSKDCDAFLPRYTSRRKWADRWKTLRLPLFPGYVFCQFEPPERMRVLTTPGVIDVVRTGNDPAPVDPIEIDAIRRIESSELTAEPYPSLARGQRVVVIGGPLTGVGGVLVQVRSGYRLVISVELLQRSVQVEIERGLVAPSQTLSERKRAE